MGENQINTTASKGLENKKTNMKNKKKKRGQNNKNQSMKVRGKKQAVVNVKEKQIVKVNHLKKSEGKETEEQSGIDSKENMTLYQDTQKSKKSKKRNYRDYIKHSIPKVG